MNYGSCAIKDINAEVRRASSDDLNALLSLLRVDVDLAMYRLAGDRRVEVSRIVRAQPNYVRLALRMYNRVDDDNLHEEQALMPNDWTSAQAPRFPAVAILPDLQFDGTSDKFSIRAPRAQPPAGTPSKGTKTSRRHQNAKRGAESRTSLALQTAEAPSSDASAPVEPAARIDALSSQLAAALHAIRDLQTSRATLESDFDSRAREGARQLFHAAARGQDDVPIVPSKLTAKQLGKVQAYDFDPSMQVSSWNHGDDWVPNVLVSPASKQVRPSRGALRALLFQSKMHEEDRTRLLTSIAKPSVWSRPPSLKPSERAILGPSGCKSDSDLVLKQDRHLERAQPLVASLNTLSRALSIVPDDASTPLDRVALRESLLELLEQLSNSLHLVSFDLTGLHKQRRQLLADALGGTAVDVDLSSSDDDWDLGDKGLYDAAKSARGVAKDLNGLSKGRGGRQPPKPTGRQDGGGDGGPPTAAQLKKRAKRKAYEKRKKGRAAQPGAKPPGGTKPQQPSAQPEPAAKHPAAAKKKKK